MGGDYASLYTYHIMSYQGNSHLRVVKLLLRQSKSKMLYCAYSRFSVVNKF